MKATNLPTRLRKLFRIVAPRVPNAPVAAICCRRTPDGCRSPGNPGREPT